MAAQGIRDYAVIVGRATETFFKPPAHPHQAAHYHIHLVASGENFDVAVNVLSRDGSEVLYHVDPDFTPPQAAALAALTVGRHAIGEDGSAGLGLDYLRQHLVARDQMALLPVDAQPPHNALHGAIDDLVQGAIRDLSAVLYVFGSTFRNAGANPTFGFQPDVGIHDVHLNQGNPVHGGFSADNGIYQDGALLVRRPGQTAADRWQAVLLAFQIQRWRTDDQGDPL